MDMILSESKNLRKLGVNTVSVVPHYDYENGKTVLRDSIESHINRIVRAKQEGFAVMLVPDFAGGDSKKIGVPLEQFLSDARNISLDWALIAEEYNVEYFATFYNAI
ncbi:MAG: hypothetical protein HY364_03670 [Candidatus Aenigmarchaeota archaeon]|nr:hypothetical protein [Candidatus Aenigmarchaeota archaeon]